MTHSIAIQCAIGGLGTGGGAEVVFGELDVPSGVLLIDASITLQPGARENRRRGCAVVTNNAAADDRDELFTDEHLREAIDDYFAFAGRGLLVLEPAVARHDPRSKIEPDGLDERGRKYRIAPDMTNGQLAVMVACWFAMRQSGIATHLDAMADAEDDTIITIGIAGYGAAAGGGPRDSAVRYEMGGMLPIGRDGWPL